MLAKIHLCSKLECGNSDITVQRWDVKAYMHVFSGSTLLPR